jgi:hypothetical protein
MNAIRAHQRASYLPVKIAFDPLEIRSPDAFGFVVGMTDIVTNRSALAADRTNSRHLISYPFDNFAG